MTTNETRKPTQADLDKAENNRIAAIRAEKLSRIQGNERQAANDAADARFWCRIANELSELFPIT